MNLLTTSQTQAQVEAEIQSLQTNLRVGDTTPETAYRLLLLEPTVDHYHLAICSLGELGYYKEAYELMRYALHYFPADTELIELKNDIDRIEKRRKKKQVVLVQGKLIDVDLKIYKDKVLQGRWRECRVCRQTFSLDAEDENKFGMAIKNVDAKHCSPECQNRGKRLK